MPQYSVGLVRGHQHEGENTLKSLFDHSGEWQYIPLTRIKGGERHHVKFHSAKGEGNNPRAAVLGQDRGSLILSLSSSLSLLSQW